METPDDILIEINEVEAIIKSLPQAGDNTLRLRAILTEYLDTLLEELADKAEVD